MPVSHRYFLTLFVFAAALAGCTCGEKVKTKPITDTEVQACIDGAACTSDQECNDRNGDDRYVCGKANTDGNRCCTRSFRKCTDDSGCCPGQVCTDQGRCADKFDECTTDAECGDAGDRVCEDWNDPVLGITKRCTYKKCGSLGECPSGQTCFNQFCVASPPCNGQCNAGEACVPQNNRCHPYGTRCQVTCQAGFLAVFKNVDAVYDTCKLSDVACDCVELPPLVSTDLGRHLSVSVAPTNDKLSIAHYDGTYGDLVVTDFDAAGKAIKSTWVDGVPATGTVVAGPSGARNGVLEPGDDVGRYTSSVEGSDGALHIAYYDVTNGDLKYVERDPTGAWGKPITVDGTDTDSGMYTSIALDSTGNPAIAYFQRAGSDTSAACSSDPSAPKVLVTGVKYALAKSAHPTSASDFTVEMVSCAARPPPPCFGCATAGSKVCIAPAAGGTACATPSSSCAAACATGEVCVQGTSGAVCEKQGSATELADLPAGVGLFPSLAFKGSTPVIAWYDHNKGNLVVSQKPASWTKVLVDGESGGTDTGDVGLFPSLVIDGAGKYNVAYHDFSRRGLRFYSSATLSPVANQTSPASTSFVDTGLFDPTLDGPSWVGADASLLIGSTGTFAAYQNATAADLRLAKLDPGAGMKPMGPNWSLVQQWDKGALGFYSQVVEMNGKLYIAHASIHAKAVSGKPTADNALHVEVVTPQ